ncbi:MAG: hypothetical protein HOP13_19965 [Alphaproteobacteria bacterium]|nr:hypothetical protein [Alphaproteobacteria bacterium]
MVVSHLRKVIACALLSATSVLAADNPVNGLANAICTAGDINAVTAALSSVSPQDELQPIDVAEAFGIATFLADLGRCTNRQAIADGFAFYKKGKDPGPLDAAFASGRVAAKPDGSATAQAGTFQGSFASLGTAGDPPSGQ